MNRMTLGAAVITALELISVGCKPSKTPDEMQVTHTVETAQPPIDAEIWAIMDSFGKKALENHQKEAAAKEAQAQKEAAKKQVRDASICIKNLNHRTKRRAMEICADKNKNDSSAQAQCVTETLDKLCGIE